MEGLALEGLALEGVSLEGLYRAAYIHMVGGFAMYCSVTCVLFYLHTLSIVIFCCGK